MSDRAGVSGRAWPGARGCQTFAGRVHTCSRVPPRPAKRHESLLPIGPFPQHSLVRLSQAVTWVVTVVQGRAGDTGQGTWLPVWQRPVQHLAHGGHAEASVSGKASHSPALGTRELRGGPARPMEDAEAPGGPAQPGESQNRRLHQGSRALQAPASLGVLYRGGQDRHTVCVLCVCVPVSVASGDLSLSTPNA